MPQPWMIGTPKRSSENRSISERGTAEPPHEDRAERGQVRAVLFGVPQHLVPDRRHGAGEGGPLGLDDPDEGLSLQKLLRHDEVRPAQPGGVRDAPGVGVELGDDDEDPVVAGDPERWPPTCWRASAGRSSGGCRRRPSGCPSSRSCSTWRRLRSRPGPATGSRAPRRRGDRRSAGSRRATDASPSPTTMTCSTVPRSPSTRARTGASSASAMMTLSSAWSMT